MTPDRSSICRSSISVIDSMHMLGSDLSRARIRHAIELLGGISRKKMKDVEKAYAALNDGQTDPAVGNEQ